MSYDSEKSVEVTATFTRPNDTTAYASGDIVANSTTAGSVVPMSFVFPTGYGKGVHIIAARLQKSSTNATNAGFLLNLYNSSPTPANGDNGAYSTTVSDYLGQINYSTMRAFSDDAAIVDDLSQTQVIHFHLDGNTIYGLLETDAAYTPAAQEVFTVTLVCHMHR